MLGEPKDDWRTARREAARAEILRVAKALASEHGLAGLSLRDLARQLGMAAPSLYSYFPSKNALYDAMFAEGWQTLLDGPPPDGPDVRTVLRRSAHTYVQWALEDPVRYQLLNQRTIPGFEPSAEAYAVAQRAYEHLMSPLRAVADVTQADLDLLTAVVGGLVNQQIANDPGGSRWVGLVDDAMDLLAHRLRERTTTTP